MKQLAAILLGAVCMTVSAQQTSVPVEHIQIDRPFDLLRNIYYEDLTVISQIVPLTRSDAKLSPRIYMAKDSCHYFLCIDIRNGEGFPAPDMKTCPELELKDTDGEITRLLCSQEHDTKHYAALRTMSVQLNPSDGTFMSPPMWDYYSTHVAYVIPDIDTFISRRYVSVSAVGGAVTYDISADGNKTVDKFNKRLTSWRKSVDRLFSQFMNDYKRRGSKPFWRMPAM